MGAMSDAAKVGAVVLIVVAMMIGLGQLVNGRVVPRGSTYYVLVRFDNGLGLRPSMPLKMAGTDAGWVEKIHLTEEAGVKQTTEAKIRVKRKVHLGHDARFIISQEGLIGEKFLAVYVGDPALEQVEEGHVFAGEQEEDITALVARASQVIQSVDDMLSNEQLGGAMRQLSGSLSESLDKVNGLLEKAGGVVDTSSGYITASLKNVEAMSANFLAMSQNLEGASLAISKLATDPQYADKVRGITDDLGQVSANLGHLSGQLDALVSDPNVQQDAKDSLRLTKETLLEAKATLQRFQQTMDHADGLIDSATGVMNTADGVLGDVGGAVGDARQKLDQFSSLGSSIKVKSSLNVRAVDKNSDRHVGGDDNYVGDLNMAVGYKNAYVSAGADNIGEDNNWNFLLGYGSLTGLSFRGGVYRGELGLGGMYNFSGNGGVEVMAYDTKDTKVNAYGYIPVGDAVKVVVGMEDIDGEQQGTAGISVDLK